MQQSLTDRIRDKTLIGDFWGEEGALALEQERLYEDSAEGKDDNSNGALSAASSTYYAAAGNAGSHAKLTRSLKWYWRALWCLIAARRYSNRLKKQAGGLSGMTADMLDIRASICGKCWFWPGSKAERLICLEAAIKKPECTDNCRALVLIQLGEITGEALHYQEAGRIPNLPPLTRIRLWRSMARMFYREERTADFDNARRLLAQARTLAHDQNLHDQEAKIKAQQQELQEEIRSAQATI